jgi:hypothetical protein
VLVAVADLLLNLLAVVHSPPGTRIVSWNCTTLFIQISLSPMSYCRRISENFSFRFWRNARITANWQSTISLQQTVYYFVDLRDAERR